MPHTHLILTTIPAEPSCFQTIYESSNQTFYSLATTQWCLSAAHQKASPLKSVCRTRTLVKSIMPMMARPLPCFRIQTMTQDYLEGQGSKSTTAFQVITSTTSHLYTDDFQLILRENKFLFPKTDKTRTTTNMEYLQFSNQDLVQGVQPWDDRKLKNPWSSS